MTTDKLQNLDTEYDQVFFIDCLPEDEYNNWKISQDLHFPGGEDRRSQRPDRFILLQALRHRELRGPSGPGRPASQALWSRRTVGSLRDITMIESVTILKIMS